MKEQRGSPKTEASREPQVGDVVHVRATVREVYADEILIVGICGTSMWAENSDIVHIEPAPLKVGDRVLAPFAHRFEPVTAVIVALHGGQAWIEQDNGYSSLAAIADLTRIDGDAR